MELPIQYNAPLPPSVEVIIHQRFKKIDAHTTRHTHYRRRRVRPRRFDSTLGYPGEGPVGEVKTSGHTCLYLHEFRCEPELVRLWCGDTYMCVCHKITVIPSNEIHYVCQQHVRRPPQKLFDSTLGYPGEGPAHRHYSWLSKRMPTTIQARYCVACKSTSCFVVGHYHAEAREPSTGYKGRKDKQRQRQDKGQREDAPERYTLCDQEVYGEACGGDHGHEANSKKRDIIEKDYMALIIEDPDVEEEKHNSEDDEVEEEEEETPPPIVVKKLKNRVFKPLITAETKAANEVKHQIIVESRQDIPVIEDPEAPLGALTVSAPGFFDEDDVHTGLTDVDESAVELSVTSEQNEQGWGDEKNYVVTKEEARILPSVVEPPKRSLEVVIDQVVHPVSTLVRAPETNANVDLARQAKLAAQEIVLQDIIRTLEEEGSFFDMVRLNSPDEVKGGLPGPRLHYYCEHAVMWVLAGGAFTDHEDVSLFVNNPDSTVLPVIQPSIRDKLEKFSKRVIIRNGEKVGNTPAPRDCAKDDLNEKLIAEVEKFIAAHNTTIYRFEENWFQYQKVKMSGRLGEILQHVTEVSHGKTVFPVVDEQVLLAGGSVKDDIDHLTTDVVGPTFTDRLHALFERRAVRQSILRQMEGVKRSEKTTTHNYLKMNKFTEKYVGPVFTEVCRLIKSNPKMSAFMAVREGKPMPLLRGRIIYEWGLLKTSSAESVYALCCAVSPKVVSNTVNHLINYFVLMYSNTALGIADFGTWDVIQTGLSNIPSIVARHLLAL